MIYLEVTKIWRKNKFHVDSYNHIHVSYVKSEKWKKHYLVVSPILFRYLSFKNRIYFLERLSLSHHKRVSISLFGQFFFIFFFRVFIYVHIYIRL